ncbi:zonular occludens toxin domain-containing protein [Cupriavidus taiwanensis]|uniref:zonular occludens toxin domain-containing protein n=1 Tax=Cupriavidus taiwanensis TaxID=164546 RepID=UPI0004156568|nr:zonular occludens toxin domain-containing protein [Cupriavidus taiwanensis]SOZ12726.1 conserved protein of unknown function [Cupriavidus taiwanensis]
MLIVHEGLPGAGKTWEAVVKRLIPALKEGRAVFARINGLDHAKIAEVAELEESRVRELLHEIPEADVLKWNDLVKNDSLVILDEAQNFWPHGSSRSMPQDQIKAVAEHRHRGLDIVLMCQVLQGAGGVHPVWVNRVDQKIVFEKLNARGKDQSYKWTSYKGMHDGRKIKFTQVNKGTESYDPKYFGTYKSHQAETTNTATYKDNRTNIWHSPVFRKWGPVMLALVAVAVYYLFHMFKGGGFEQSLVKDQKPVTPHVVTTTTVTSTPASGAAAVQPTVPGAQPAGQSVAQVPDSMAADYVTAISAKWRPRLSGMIYNGRKGRLLVEWYDDSLRLKERLSAAQLEEMGWGVQRSAYGEHVMLHKAGAHIAVTSWPIEPMGKISEETKREISAAAGNDVSRSDS